MNLTGFEVFKYRNVINSGWIEVNKLATLVGQNECGKSNLLQALYILNPFEATAYNINGDWPIDMWPPGDASEVVCRAEFELSESETSELFENSIVAANKPDASEEDEVKAQLDSSLPVRVKVKVSKDYNNQLHVDLPDISNLDRNAATEWITSSLPLCVYMDDYAAFTGHSDLTQLADRLDSQGRPNLSEADKTILITLELAAIKVQDLVTKASSDEGRTLRGFDTNAASAYLTRRFKHMWKQKPVKFNIRTDGPTLDILIEDEGLGAFVQLERRSRGFQWFVSFIWRFTHASKGVFANCILLLDEPGVHLHHAGHRDLLDFLESLAETNTLIYTTHLATMLDPAYPERVRIMEVRDHHSTVKNSMVSSQREPMMVIESLLGLTGSMSGLLGSRQNLIVEGGDDVVILQKLSGVLRNSGEKGLSDSIFLIPADGAPKTPMYAGFMVGNRFDAAVLLDSDPEGETAKKKIAGSYLSMLADEGETNFRVLMLGDVVKTSQNEFAIEDLFPIEFYLECVNEAYGTNLTVTDLPTDGSTQNCKRAETILRERGMVGKKIDKERVLRSMIKRFDSFNTKSDLPTGTYEKARKVVDKINTVFD